MEPCHYENWNKQDMAHNAGTRALLIPLINITNGGVGMPSSSIFSGEGQVFMCHHVAGVAGMARYMHVLCQEEGYTGKAAEGKRAVVWCQGEGWESLAGVGVGRKPY